MQHARERRSGRAALADRHIDAVFKGEWKGVDEKIYNSYNLKFKDSIDKLNQLSDQIRILSAKICSFKVDTLLKLEATLEKEDFVAKMINLKKECELLLGRINEKIEDKGYKKLDDIPEFEAKIAYNNLKHMFRFSLPCKIGNKINVKGGDFLKFKVVGIKNVQDKK